MQKAPEDFPRSFLLSPVCSSLKPAFFSFLHIDGNGWSGAFADALTGTGDAYMSTYYCNWPPAIIVTPKVLIVTPLFWADLFPAASNAST